ncbi:hypothetical protein XENOCAPTIV_008947 [Xenoophorus captivus]|uniref:Uncharacterized protein n=1 Tax=Xenoophorus captivus TaxID=1517983 RepID=A0ABV0QQS7_9TELE
MSPDNILPTASGLCFSGQTKTAGLRRRLMRGKHGSMAAERRMRVTESVGATPSSCQKRGVSYVRPDTQNRRFKIFSVWSLVSDMLVFGRQKHGIRVDATPK